MSNIKNRKEGGFTIIEVLIVLAIAGLIMLIVFLAVPALQRNSRNTQRKNDVSNLLGAMSEYANNNGGSLPGAVTVTGNQALFCASGTCTAAASTPSNIGYYNSGTVSIVAAVPGAVPNNDTVVLIKGATCNGNTPVAGSGRSVVAYFSVEPNTTAQCQGS
ncbi:MAG: type II secretion system protein [Candidatus Saccharibacteria bacterium]